MISSAAISRFTFATAGQVRFGRGVAGDAAAEIARLGGCALVVHGASARHLDRVLAGLPDHITFACGSEPDLPMVQTAVAQARAAGADCVLSVGGGSVIDMGKAVSALTPAPGDVTDYMEVVGKGQPLAAPPLPHVAVPTTAGTGAEVTRNAVIGVPAHGRKVSIRDARMLPVLALVDPSLTDGVPKPVTLASGLDAITQVIEPYLSSRANPMTDALCRDAIPRGLSALASLMAQDTPAARDDMALTSLFGGLALANAGLGAVHGLAGVIGGMVPGAPHGAICGALLPHVLAANLRAVPARSVVARRIAEVTGWIETALGLPQADALADWARAQGLPGLYEMGVRESQLLQISQAAQAASSMAANPVALPDDALVAILKAAG